MQENPLKNRAYFVSGSIVGAALVVFIYVSINAVNSAHLITPPVQVCSDNNIPRAAYVALLYYDLYQQAPPSFNGIKIFYSKKSGLPEIDQTGKPIDYIESDIYPAIPKINRGTQRIVVGNNGAAYYTPNHYKSFVEITPDCVTWFSRNARDL
jgi:ribonuclease T1